MVLIQQQRQQWKNLWGRIRNERYSNNRTGGFGREVAWLIERINNENPTWKIKGFIDDNEQLWGKQEDNYKVLGGTDYLKNCGEIYAGALSVLRA